MRCGKICGQRDGKWPAGQGADQRLKKCGIVAACLVLLVGIGFGTYICVEDIKEYNTAVQFFNEYNLSTEGLTRQEIKNVYSERENIFFIACIAS